MLEGRAGFQHDIQHLHVDDSLEGSCRFEISVLERACKYAHLNARRSLWVRIERYL